MSGGFTSVREGEDPIPFLLWITDGLCDLPVQSHG